MFRSGGRCLHHQANEAVHMQDDLQTGTHTHTHTPPIITIMILVFQTGHSTVSMVALTNGLGQSHQLLVAVLYQLLAVGLRLLADAVCFTAFSPALHWHLNLPTATHNSHLHAQCRCLTGWGHALNYRVLQGGDMPWITEFYFFPCPNFPLWLIECVRFEVRNSFFFFGKLLCEADVTISRQQSTQAFHFRLF